MLGGNSGQSYAREDQFEKRRVDVLSEIGSAGALSWTGQFYQQLGDDEYFSLFISPSKGAIYERISNLRRVDYGFGNASFNSGEVDFGWLYSTFSMDLISRKLFVVPTSEKTFLIPRSDLHVFVLNIGKKQPRFGWMEKRNDTVVNELSYPDELSRLKNVGPIELKIVSKRPIERTNRNGIRFAKQQAVAVTDHKEFVALGARFTSRENPTWEIRVVGFSNDDFLVVEISEIVTKRSKFQGTTIGCSFFTFSSSPDIALIRPSLTLIRSD
jgi:hypothetical protein